VYNNVNKLAKKAELKYMKPAHSYSVFPLIVSTLHIDKNNNTNHQTFPINQIRGLRMTRFYVTISNCSAQQFLTLKPNIFFQVILTIFLTNK